MKKIFAMLVALAIVGCDNNNDYDTQTDLAIIWEEQSPYDESISVGGNNDIIYLFKNNQLQKTIYSQKEMINNGYGEMTIESYRTSSCIFLKEGIVIPWENRVGNKKIIDFYTNKFDSITTIASEHLDVSTLGDNILYTRKYSNNGKDNIYTVNEYNAKGMEVFQKSYINFKVDPPSLYKNIKISHEEYVNFEEYSMQRIHATDGVKWNLLYSSLIPNKPIDEVKPPKYVLDKYELVSGIINLIFNVTYYSGEKENITIKIDLQTDSLI